MFCMNYYEPELSFILLSAAAARFRRSSSLSNWCSRGRFAASSGAVLVAILSSTDITAGAEIAGDESCD